MRRTKNADLAKDEAIFTTLGLVFFAFVTAFIITFGLPRLLSTILTNPTPEPQKTVVTVFTSLLTSIFFMWFSGERVKTRIGLAIDAAVNEKAKDYEEKHPDLVEIESIQVQEYCCVIPSNSISQEVGIKVVTPIPSICSRRAGRDAVIRAFAYNNDMLNGIAAIAAQFALVEMGKDKEISRSKYDEFRSDIYAYLKAWLMFSIAHDRSMPVEYIKQRYSYKKAYVKAIENVKKQMGTDTVKKCLDEAYRNKAIEILNDYLDELIQQLNSK